MSFPADACSTRPAKAPRVAAPPASPTFPAHHAAHGRLYRAIVTLPEAMCSRHLAFQERWVFFDCPNAVPPTERLELLLALAWNVDTAGWTAIGSIYNVTSARDLIEENDGHDDTALFECAWGGAEGVQHVSRDDVDLFVPPTVRERLEAAMTRIQALAALNGGAA